MVSRLRQCRRVGPAPDAAAGQADPVAEYLSALQNGDVRDLETVWPGDVVIHDPRAGDIRGHNQLRQFVRDNQSWWAQRHATIETVASTSVGNRAVVELRARLADSEGQASGLAVGGRRRVAGRSVGGVPHLLQPAAGRRETAPAATHPRERRCVPGDIVARYLAALEAGDAEAIVRTFAADGYLREPFGLPRHTPRRPPSCGRTSPGVSSAGGGILLEHCAMTDDGTRCALEYNCVRWGARRLAPQAGIAVFERGPDGLLQRARIYDDMEPPVAPLNWTHGRWRRLSGRRSGRRRRARSRR